MDNNTINFEKNLYRKKEMINDFLKNCLKEDYPEIIFQAMNYSVFPGGKRLRPVLLMSSCEAVGGDIKKSVPFASAIEMIHSYSLIHDDLPMMDNDDLRRGQATNHIKYGEATALLAGDALLNMAYEIMANNCENNLSIENIKALNYIAGSSGVFGMIGGQVVDMSLDSDKKSSYDRLEYIHKNKTGKLIKASLVSGAIIGGANDDIINIFGEIGEKLGVSFQIKDDMLDVCGNVKELGKNINSDIEQNKVTYVTLYGIEKSKEYFNDINKDIFDLLKNLDKLYNINCSFLEYFIGSLINRQN